MTFQIDFTVYNQQESDISSDDEPCPVSEIIWGGIILNTSCFANRCIQLLISQNQLPVMILWDAPTSIQNHYRPKALSPRYYLPNGHADLQRILTNLSPLRRMKTQSSTKKIVHGLCHVKISYQYKNLASFQSS